MSNDVVIVEEKKSIVASLVLTFFFGGLGLLYSSIMWGIIFTIIEVATGLFTMGLSAIVIHPITMIVGVILCKRHNKNLKSKYDNAVKEKQSL